MNAVSLYLSTCRCVMQAKRESPETWSDLYKQFPLLRQAISCCVCTKILNVPIGPVGSICQHHICESCRGGKMRLRPGCGWCKDHSLYEENIQLRIIIQCYKQLCTFLASLDLLSILDGEIDKNALVNCINEGLEITDTYNHNNKDSPKKDNILPNTGIKEPKLQIPINNKPLYNKKLELKKRHQRKDKDTQTDLDVPHLLNAEEYTHEELDALNDTNIDEIRRKSAHLSYHHHDTGENAPQRSSKAHHLSEHDYMKEEPLCYSVIMPNGDEPKLTIRRKSSGTQLPITKRKNRIDGFTSSISRMDILPSKPKKHKTKDNKKKEGCRCGTATPTPGKLTCCGQRCPCYTTFKPCVDCICRGCHNPRKGFPPSSFAPLNVAEEVEISVI